MLRRAPFALLLVALLSAPAHADGFLAPFVGNTFGIDAAGCAGQIDCSTRRGTYGASIGTMRGGSGFEGEVGYTKNFFGAAPGAENSVLSVMANALFLGAGTGIKAYFVSGIGVIRASVTPPGRPQVDSTALAVDLGVGVFGFFTKHVGIRVDLRRFHTLQDIEVPLFDGHLGFWRAGLGLALTF